MTYLLSKVGYRLHEVTYSTITTLQPVKVQVKVKFSLEQAMRAQGVVEV